MIKVLPVSPIFHRIYDQPLYQTLRFKPGANQLNFLTGDRSDSDLLNNVEAFNGGMPAGQSFTLKRVALMSAGDTRASDFHRVIKDATFVLDFIHNPVLKLPATQVAWANIKEINTLLYSIKKLPQVQQETILRNLRVAEGHVIEPPIEILPLECFRVRLEMNRVPELKREIQITCLLGGKNVRGVC